MFRKLRASHVLHEFSNLLKPSTAPSRHIGFFCTMYWPIICFWEINVWMVQRISWLLSKNVSRQDLNLSGLILSFLMLHFSTILALVIQQSRKCILHLALDLKGSSRSLFIICESACLMAASDICDEMHHSFNMFVDIRIKSICQGTFIYCLRFAIRTKP